MKAVKVTYTVKPEFVQTNQNNITKVMDYLKNNPIEGMWYKAFLMEDGQSFMHINIAKDESTLQKLLSVSVFNDFRTQLKDSGPLAPPSQSPLDPIGDSQHFFS
jgi:hypothetical protein